LRFVFHLILHSLNRLLGVVQVFIIVSSMQRIAQPFNVGIDRI
jgi:hypothetical protein